MPLDQVAQQLARLRQWHDTLPQHACESPPSRAQSSPAVIAEFDAILTALQGAIDQPPTQQTTAFQQNDALFRLLVASVTDYAIFMLDLQGQIISWNEGAARIKGYAADEIIGRHFSCFYPPEDQARGKPAHGLRVAAAEGRFADEGWRVRRDGSRFWANVIITAISDEAGQLRGFAKVTRDVTERKQAQEALQRHTEKLEEQAHLLDLTPAVVRDLDHRIIFWSQGMEQLYGWSKAEAVGQVLHRLLQTHFPHPLPEIEADLHHTGHWRGELTHTRRDGTRITVVSHHVVHRDTHGTPIAILAVNTDITEHKRAEEAVRQSEARFRTLVHNAADMITVLDADGTIRYKSPASTRVLGYPPDVLLGSNVFALIHPDDQAAVQHVFQQVRHTSGTTFQVEYRCRHYDGSWRVLESTGTNLLAHPAVQGIVVNSRDITEQQLAQEQLRHQALYDALTGLPNRTLFLDRLEQALLHAPRHPEHSFAVLFLDLDRFKTINDSLGHLAGDQLLVDVAQRLTACLRAGDTVARFGGDEFAILLEEVADVTAALQIAQRIQQSVAAPFQLRGQQVLTSTSIGMAFPTTSAARAEDLLRDADTALYCAKLQGKARVVVFDPAMHIRALQRFQLEAELRQAIEREELQLYYQPIVDLASGQIREVEALVRWQHPARGIIAPAQFIPVAEETGLIVPLGAWVLRSACAQAQAWQAGGLPPLRVAVNLSTQQFRHTDLRAVITDTLAETGLAPQYLKLELTESSVMDDVEAAIALLWDLKRMGIQIAVDDFGTGYSSLSYLKRLPITTLKVDTSFVRDIGSDPNDTAITTAIIALGRSLGLQVIAEGVETAEQLAFLHAQQCDAAQGYLYSRPLPADILTTFLQEGQRFSAAAVEASPS